jgi:hypothetical protein
VASGLQKIFGVQSISNDHSENLTHFEKALSSFKSPSSRGILVQIGEFVSARNPAINSEGRWACTLVLAEEKASKVLSHHLKLRRASWRRRSDSVHRISRDLIATKACCSTTKVALLRVILDRLYEAGRDPGQVDMR